MLYKFGRMLFFIYFRLLFRARVEGAEHMPDEGPVILCANHISLNDPMLIGCMLKRPVSFLAKAQLFRIPPARKILTAMRAMPVDRDNPGMSSFKSAMAVLNAGGVLGIFAQGRRITLKEHDDGSIKSGVALFALKSGATVLPVKITPRYRPFLPLTVKIAPPVDLSAFYGQKARSDVLRAAAAVIYDRVKEM